MVLIICLRGAVLVNIQSRSEEVQKYIKINNNNTINNVISIKSINNGTKKYDID